MPGGMATGRRPNPEPAVQGLDGAFPAQPTPHPEISRIANCSHTKESPKNNPHYFLIAELILPSVLLATCTPTYSKIQKGEKNVRSCVIPRIKWGIRDWKGECEHFSKTPGQGSGCFRTKQAPGNQDTRQLPPGLAWKNSSSTRSEAVTDF